jgi:molybdopterin converting factor small subunit
MMVRVRLFARAKDIAGSDWLDVELSPGATVGELRRRLMEVFPALESVIEHSALAVNDEFAGEGLTLPVNAEVALLPPVSGGGE